VYHAVEIVGPFALISGTAIAKGYAWRPSERHASPIDILDRHIPNSHGIGSPPERPVSNDGTDPWNYSGLQKMFQTIKYLLLGAAKVGGDFRKRSGNEREARCQYLNELAIAFAYRKTIVLAMKVY
jgi:hypothetical protein